MKSKRLTRLLNPLLLGLLLTLLMAAPALADVVTILPDGVVSTGGWTGVAAGNLNAGGGGAGDATYATITGTLDTFTVSIANNAAYSGATINAVRVYVRAAALSGGGGGERITFGSTAPVVSTSGNNTLVRNTPTDAFFDLVGIANSGDVDALEISVNTTALGAVEEARIYDIWVDVTYTPLAAANELNACNSCHNYPPNEGASRNVSAGAVVGSHAAHSAFACTQCHPNNAVLNHRGGLGANGTEGKIDMLANISGGSYSLGSAGFLQDNEDGTGLGFCSNVTCHSGVATPQWGDATGLNCDGCHGAPPATNAHATHYTAKGWGATDVSGTYCLQCHPDNTTTHALNGTPDVTLTPTGSGITLSCGSAPALGCHNGKQTPQWGTTNIACLDCHTTSGTGPADPTSGLHDETPVVSGVQHNPLDANFTGCEDCHTATPSSLHWDGIAQLSAPTINFDAGMTGFVDGTPPTCTASCHSESGISGPWARKWHENSDVAGTASCVGCHGDWTSGWNGGVTHRSDTGAGSTYTIHSTGTNYECQDCHALGKASTNTGYTYTEVTNDWGGTSKHGNGTITMNDSNTAWARNGTLSGCSTCHPAFDGIDGAAGQNSFAQTGWNFDKVVGEVVVSGCDTCHGGGGDYWPKGSAYPDRAGEHTIHVTRLAAKLGFALPGSDVQQKQMCDYCHNDATGAGGGGHDDNVSPADVGGFNKYWDATADGTSAYTAGNQTCANACHNGKTTTPGTFGWNDAFTAGASGNCLLCHTAGGGVANEIINPTTGLHDVTPSVSGVQHDQSLDAGGCLICHTSTPSSSHIDGTGQTSSPTITVAGSSGFSDGSPATCNASCHSDGGNWARKWHESSTASDGNECAGCHGTFFTGFNNGVTVRHQTTTSGDADGKIQSNHATGPSGKLCGTCHAYDGADGLGHKWATHHMNNIIELSDNTTFSDVGGTLRCNACHTTPYGTGDGQFEFADAGLANGWGRAFVGGPTASCTGCHSAHITGSAGVGPDSPHSNNVTGLTCEGCHTGHGNAGTIEILNNPAVGINYSANGESGISLGGTDTTGGTEAEICWNCHDANAVSEWGLNTDTNGAAANYNHGSMSTGNSNWRSGNWISGQGVFGYKTAAVQSTHAANSASGVSGNDAVGNIRCSYCHDVHDTADRTGVIATANDPDGKPFLRGNWMGNPYKEDGAPQNGMSWTGIWGNVPRGGAGNSEYGGYQIDQNNGNPTNGWTADGSSGLCSLCHGSNTNGTWSLPGDINALNQFGTASADWVGTNGHANSVIGGNGTGRANIFRTSDRAPSGVDTNGARPDMGYANHGTGVGYGFRGVDGRSFTLTVSMNNGSRPYGGSQYNWNATVDNTTTDLQYHKFSCSKCHSPHASRLPRLMITNCLDTSHNSWDQNAGGGGVNNGGTANANGITLGAGTSPDSWNRTWSNVTSAQNCHRVAGSDDASPAGFGTGWNNVTPW